MPAVDWATRFFLHLLPKALRARLRLLVGAMGLQPVDQVQPTPGQKGLWLATGSDPKFECIGAGFPLSAGWYSMRIDLEDVDGDRLEPMLYFDHGNGMHETWSTPLNFVRSGFRRHRGVVLLPFVTLRVRLDPACQPCAFHARGLRLRKISRISATWQMWRAVSARQDDSRRDIMAVALSKLRHTGGRRSFGDWLVAQYAQKDSVALSYDSWLRRYDHAACGGPSATTKFSIVLPTYNTPEQWLRRCLETVLAQTYPNWELCIADDASTDQHVRRVLQHYADRDPRIKLAWRARNGHIVQASNTALALASGDFVALLDHDDELHPEALASVALALQRHPQWKILYSDEDKIDEQGQRFDPYFKPDWNADLLCGQNFFSHLGVYSRELVNSLGGFREGTEGSQDWDLALRCSEKLSADQVGHIPLVLYHWRALSGSTARGVDQKSYAHDAAIRVLREHFQRREVAAEVLALDGILGMFRVRYPLSDSKTSVSIVIPTRDRLDLLQRCVESVLKYTTYANFEIVIVDNRSCEPATAAYLSCIADDPRVRVLRHDGPFNYAIINNAAVATCTSELICLLNNDIEVITPGWLEELASHALRPGIGAVGAMLYYPNDTIQHAGVITGVHGVAAHPYCGMPRGYAGQMARAKLTQSMSAVTAACLMVRRDLYRRINGLDGAFQVAFNDVDFCLRLRQAGYSNIWTPVAEMYHHESASRGEENTPEKRARFAREVALMQSRWGSQLEFDPAYNPNLTLSGEPFSLAFPPRHGVAALHQPAAIGVAKDSVAERSGGVAP